jgi:single-stranded-DNA-specific exonuclease
MNYKWIFEKIADKNTLKNFSAQLNNLHPILSNILIQRGIDTYDKAEAFFNPDLKKLHDPFLMKNMDIAVLRLQKAIQNNENILIYGDYDVDGTTSVALVYSFLSKYTKNISFYIPDRYTEGYGISIKGIDYAAENKISLVIALDCGIKAVDKINYANKKNIDFIICDHHTPGNTVPKAIAVLNPKQKDCKYPYKELSGCGVGFKFMNAFAKKNKIPDNEIFQYLDFLAISIASDIVPITGENRILEHFGLQKLKTTDKPGLLALMQTAGLIKNTNSQKQDLEKLTVSDIVFKIGPRINAAGRMSHAKASVELLIEKNPENAKIFAENIDKQNSERKNQQDQIFSEIINSLDKNKNLENLHSIVVYNKNWNKGIVGIVASKIIEEYYKPTIVLTKSGNNWTGSGRSIDNFDLYSAIDACSDFILNFGGHKFAAGLTITEQNLQNFIHCFENNVAKNINKDLLTPKLIISGQLAFSDINNKFVRILKRFAPFGPENMKPIFITTNVRDTGLSRIIGNDKKHLKLELIDKSGTNLGAIAFNSANLFDKIKTKNYFDIAYTISENYFNGKTYTQLEIKDIKLKE